MSSESNCGCQKGRFVRFLARHPAARRAFAGLSRSRLADLIAGLLARALIRRYRHRPVDYLATLESHICSDQHRAALAGDNMDCEFAAGLTGRPAARAKLASFLESLEGLDSPVRTGLLKTWLHTGLVTAKLREADFLDSRDNERRQVHPIDAIVAPFGHCNLRCRGCYTLQELGQPSASPGQLDDVVRQLVRLNVYHVLLVGKGEPFYDAASRHSLFRVVRRHPQVFFSVYSNGTTVTPGDIRQLRGLSNLVVLLSLDGPEEINDWRRGPDVYRKVIDTFRRMREAGLLFGYISTAFRQNWQQVLDPAFVGQMASLGCRLGYYSLFVTPDESGEDSDPASHEMMLDASQREQYFERFWQLDAQAPIPLIDVDGIEAHFGCRAKRGGTLYVDGVTGQVSPCIRAPLACQSCNVYRPAGRNRLSEIIHSEPFRRYREERPSLSICEAFSRCEASRISPGVKACP
jgi:MoaA/NifB/PqqE/SkfB family radical SAM enzyme